MLPDPWGYLDWAWASLCVYIFHLQTKRALQAHSSLPQLPTLWRAEFTDKDIRTLHSSCLNGSPDHSPVRSLLFLAQPSLTQNLPPNPGHWHSTSHLGMPAGALLPWVWIDCLGLNPCSATSNTGRCLHLFGPQCPHLYLERS